MDSRKITFIRDINVVNYATTLKVRVTRLWKYMSKTNQDQLFSIELILMDEQGTKIHARVFSNNIPQFGTALLEGGTYYQRNPNMGAINNEFKYTDQNQRIVFQYNTKLTICNDFSGPLYGFDFADFPSINSQTCPQKWCFDVIGELTASGSLDQTNNDKSKHKIRIDLTDIQGEQIKVTLFGPSAYEISDYLETNIQNERIFLIIQFAKLHVYGGFSFVTSNFQIIKLFINSDIEEINSFRKELLRANGNESSQSILRTLHSTPTTAKDAFEAVKDVKNISEVLEVPDKETTFVLVATIIYIKENIPWFFNSCTTCGRRVFEVVDMNPSYLNSGGIQDESKIQCRTRDCNKKTVKFVTKFMIPLQVQDPTGNISLTMFDDDAKKILNISSSQLIKKHTELGNDLYLLPDEIKDLKDKKLAFMVKVTDYNVVNNSNVYSIKKTTADADIIKDMEAKLRPQPVTHSESYSLGPLEIQTDVPKYVQDSYSQTGQNISPPTVEQDTATSPIKKFEIPNDLKRNLADVYEIDSTEMGSSTKTKKFDPDNHAKKHLITPKLET